MEISSTLLNFLSLVLADHIKGLALHSCCQSSPVEFLSHFCRGITDNCNICNSLQHFCPAAVVPDEQPAAHSGEVMFLWSHHSTAGVRTKPSSQLPGPFSSSLPQFPLLPHCSHGKLPLVWEGCLFRGHIALNKAVIISKFLLLNNT